LKLTSENYFGLDAAKAYCSVSQLKRFIGSGGKVGCEVQALAEINGEIDPPEPSKAMLLGSYVDCLLLEPEKKDTFTANHPEMFSSRGETKGQLKSDYTIADAMVKTAKADKVFMKALSGKKQQIMTGEIFGVPFKIKVDVLGDKKITDLKTCASITETQFNPVTGLRETFAEFYDYDLQGAIYQEIVRQNTGKKLPFFLACISKEKVPDHEVIWIDDESLEERLFNEQANIIHVGMLKRGEVEPKACGVCDYCRSRKKVKKAINWREIGGIFE
jgi:hypothetical protein